MSATRLALAWILIVLAAKSQGETGRTLLSVHVLYRHGERTPVDPYPNDPYKVSISRQFYIGVNRKYPGSLDHVFLRDEETQTQNWGTVLTPY